MPCRWRQPIRGTNYYLDPLPDRLVWRFTHNGIEYGRMIAEVTPDGANATDVSYYFEEVRDNPAVERFHFLREWRASPPRLRSGGAPKRPVDQAAVQAGIDKVYANNPVANQMKMIDRISERMDEMAPPDGEEFERPRGSPQPASLQEIRGCGSDNGVPNPC